MKKSKIEIGQCYERYDNIYEVIGKGKNGKWFLRHVITKEVLSISEDSYTAYASAIQH